MVKNKFITKSVKTVTLGEKLKEVRSERRISLAEASRATRIQVKYLEKLEEGKYKDLPADVYVKGFLKSYANYLGVSDSALIKAFEREKEIQKNLKREDAPEKFFKPIDFSDFAITPKIITLSAIFILVVLGFFYIYRQADLFISTPQLSVVDPLDGSATAERVIKVSGISERDADVTINNQKVVVDSEGKFSESLALQSGMNTITVRAKNRFDKEAVKTIQVRGDFTDEAERIAAENEAAEQAAQAQEKLKIEISTDPDPVWVSVSADGNLVFSGLIDPQESKSFEASAVLLVTAAKGKNTFVRVGGGEKIALSLEEGMVENVEFKK